MASPHYAPPTSPLIHTPTSKYIPSKNILLWSAEETADYMDGLGFGQHRDLFIENEIVGDALIHLNQEDLTELGITSIGHKLSILKAVYHIKIAHDVPIDADHYVPISATLSDQNPDTTYVTVSELQKLIAAVKIRDERVYSVESELRKVTDAFHKLREEMLPIVKTIKNETKPLPHPSSTAAAIQHANEQPLGRIDRSKSESSEPVTIDRQPTPQPALSQPPPSGLSRKFSTKKLFLGGANNNTQKPALSPTHHANTRDTIDAIANSQTGSSSTLYGQGREYGTLRSDRSSDATLVGATPASPPPIGLSRSFSTSQPDVSKRYQRTPTNDLDNPVPREKDRDATRSVDRHAPPLVSPASQSGSQVDDTNPPTVEIFKSFRVSMDDPCYKVLPAALKRYNIQADWQHYALYIVYGDQERCLALDEKPLILFKQLDKEGKKPTFMLRKHISPETGQPGGVINGGPPITSQYRQPVLPGGVL